MPHPNVHELSPEPGAGSARPDLPEPSSDAPARAPESAGLVVPEAPAGRRLRVAMVLASPFPANHGTPGSIREMAVALAERGVEVHVVCYHFGEGPDPAGVRVARVRDWGFARTVVVGPTREKPLLDLLMVETLVRLVRREGIDILHAHNYEGALIGWCAKLLTGRPLIYNAINTMSDELPSYGFLRPRALAVGLARLLDALVPRLGDRTIAISTELAEFLRARGVPERELRVIPLGVDTSRFEHCDRALVRERLGCGERPVVMYTGILDRLQRIDYLLEAMRLVADAIPQARLVMVANTLRASQMEEVREHTRRLGLEASVQVIESAAFDEIPGYLAAADVAVLSRPHCPGFPVKLLNYMAAALPVVVFEGSSKGLSHMQNAVIVPDHDWRGLAKGIRLLIEDRELAGTLGRRAHEWVREHYSLRGLVDQTLALYRELAPDGESHR